jgi:acyl carrier protein
VTKQEFLSHFEDVLEADPGSIKEGQALSDLDSWDSLAKMSFIAMIDEQFGETLIPDKIGGARTIQDLIALLGDQITD